MLMSPSWPLASAPEALFWMLVALAWVAVQIIQKARRQGGKPSAPPAMPGDTGNRDLDDFLADMFARRQPAATPAPVPKPPMAHQPPAPAIPRTAAPKPVHPEPKAMPPYRAAIRQGRPAATRPHIRPLQPAAVNETARLPASVQLRGAGSSIQMPARAGLALPSLAALGNIGGAGRRRRHRLTQDLRRPQGPRQAALWREVFGPPRALAP